jgi:hypothetical protein
MPIIPLSLAHHTMARACPLVCATGAGEKGQGQKKVNRKERKKNKLSLSVTSADRPSTW